MENNSESTPRNVPIFTSVEVTNKPVKMLDEELFKRMANKDNDELAANKAFKEISNKYGGYVWKICLIMIKSDKLMASEIAKDTLYKAFFNAGKFKKNLSVKAWLGTMAKNACIDYFKKDNKIKPILMGEEIPKGSRPFTESNGFSRLPNETKIFWEAWFSLDEHKQDVLKAYLRHYDISDMGDNKHLLDEEVEFLCKTHKDFIKNRYYIPKLRDRAWKELQKKCKINMPLKN